MSDALVSHLVAEMENYLKGTESPDPEHVAAWNARFQAAVENAERGPEWKGTVDRAHALSETIQKRIGGLNYEREQLRLELNSQALGQRALKGYSSSTQ